MVLNFTRKEILVIGTSYGGPIVLKKILSDLPVLFPIRVVIAQHLPKRYLRIYMEELNKVSKLEVKQVRTGEKVEKGKIFLCPGGYHIQLLKLTYCRAKLIKLDDYDSVFIPSIDLFFQSAASIYKDKVIGLLLTGLSHDGVKGMEYIKKLGGVTIVQEPGTCSASEMPVHAIERGIVDYIEKPENIVDRIMNIMDPAISNMKNNIKYKNNGEKK